MTADAVKRLEDILRRSGYDLNLREKIIGPFFLTGFPILRTSTSHGRCFPHTEKPGPALPR